MGTVSLGVITNDIDNPIFVRDSIGWIRNRGIMKLGSGILKTPSNIPNGKVAVVLPEQTGGDVPLDSLKAIMDNWETKRSRSGDYDIYFRRIPWASGSASANQPEGDYVIDFVLAYNPSAPSLYLFNPESSENWQNIRVHKVEPEDITTEIAQALDTDPVVLNDVNKSLLSGFKDTSIRLIFFLSAVYHPAAINYQEV